MPSLKFTLTLLIGFAWGFQSPALAAESSFARCVRILHKQGGMALTHYAGQSTHADARSRCLARPSDAVLSCQNRLFYLAGMSPVDALDACESGRDSSSTSAQEFPHGKFDPILPLTSSHQKTVCSITVNSKNESQIFKTALPAFRHIELLAQPEDSTHFFMRDDHWLDRACGNPDLKCDVVVISGHFAGTFLGSSGFDVGIEPLVERSNNGSCKNIFQAAQDVFLFGCNTLAERGPDRGRTPEVYRQVLIEDGLDPATAQRISAQRFTQYGPTFRKQLQWLFPNANHIVGYPAGAPSGDHISSTLKAFLKKLAPNYATSLTAGNEAPFRNAFNASLASTDAVSVRGLSGESRRASITGDEQLLPANSTQAYSFAAQYVKSFGPSLPAAAWHLVNYGVDRGLLSSTQIEKLRSAILSAAPNRKLSCAIALDERSDVADRYLSGKNCSSPDWLTP